jgi:eukaryotic-like serine/threonine-protein kinase
VTADPQAADEFVGTRRFLVLRRIGAGGMGVVYEAVDRDRNARVALKTLRTLKPDAILRFKNEFRALQDLHHPNLVSLGELFEEQEQWFFTMEMVRGVHFLDYVRGGADASAIPTQPAVNAPNSDDQSTVIGPVSEPDLPISAPRSISTRLASGADERRLRSALRQLALGLAALHRAQKVHRDIKPSNIIVTDEGRVVLLDFGLVADLAATATPESHLVGTFSYMAPEQAGLKPVGPAADWYSVGVLLYQSLTGRLPVQGSAREVLILKQAYEPPAPSTFAEVPADLDDLAVDLLRIDPKARPEAREILRRLGAEEADVFAREAHFIGRRAELNALRLALSTVRREHGVTMIVHGESGVGKSALTRRFAESVVLSDPKALVLSGRCYERESVPYKAVDGVIDSLSRYLSGLPEADQKPVLPRQRGLIGQVFPVMRKLEAVAQAPRPAAGQLDPQVQRARLFYALRDMFARIAEKRALVLMIDDLQWADADSLALLAEVTRPPDEPRFLLVATMRAALKSEVFRPEGEGARTVEQVAAMFAGDVRGLELGALPRDDARALVSALLRDTGSLEEVSPDLLAAEAAGHPLFIDELVRRRVSLGREAGALRLEDAIRHRITRLDPPARRLLELVAVAAAPIEQDTAARAVQVDFDELTRQAALLRAESLVRTGGARRTDPVETYHDRVREAVLMGLDATALASWHGRLALAFEGQERADTEALAIHWRDAGHADKAADYAYRAAREAEEAYAFDRAARLYRMTLELRPQEGAARGAIQAELGAALANAGRGAEAAAAYLSAAETHPSGEALDLRRRAADQLLRSGHIDQAMSTFRAVLGDVGMDMPETPRSALAALVFRRAQVRLRGLEFRERSPREIPAEDLTRIDTCWSVAAGLGLVDTIVGSYFQARCLLLALDAGEPSRVARALAMEASYSAASGSASEARTALLLQRTYDLSSRLGQPYTLGWASGAEGIAAALEGRWKTGFEACERAEGVFRDRCTGVAWEIVTMRWFSTWSLGYLGALSELSRRVPDRLREAKDRGDLYAAIGQSTSLANLVWLAQDAPEEARERSREATRAWSQRKFHVENWWAMHAERQADLYEGRAEEAHRAIEAEWPRLSGSMMLMVQATKLESLHLRARAALMLAATGKGDKKALLRTAARDAGAMEKERSRWAAPLAVLLRAGIAAAEGDLARALGMLELAAQACEAADMSLFAAVARYRRGQILRGDEGRALCDQSDAWMANEGVFNRARMVGMLAPGFPG